MTAKSFTKQKIVAFFLAALTAGCGGSGGDDAPSLPPLPKLTDGEWKTRCSYEGGYSKESITFTGTTYQKVKIFYNNDPECKTPQYKVETSGTYVVGPQDPYTAQGGLINLIFGAYSATPLTEDAADNLNSSSFCGFTDWAENTPKDIFDQDCGGITWSQNEVFHDIYRIESGTGPATPGMERGDLVFGFLKNDTDGRTPETRLDQFSHIFIYRH